MKLLYDKDILTIISAGLRCGRWGVTRQHKKKKTKKEIHDIGWHLGKTYAYLWMLTILGIAVQVETTIPDFYKFIKTHYKGRIYLFPGQFHYAILMKKDWFDATLQSEQPHQGKSITRDIRKMCPEIK